jgi:hypothetical protein
MKKILLLLLLVQSYYAHTQVVTQFPFKESFETLTPGLGQQIPKGWVSINLNEKNSFWDVVANSANTTFAKTGNNAINCNFGFNKGNNDWLITRPLKMTKNSKYTIGFWVKKVLFPPASVEKLRIMVGKDTTETAMLAGEELSNDNIDNEQYEFVTYVFKAPSDGNYYVGFLSYSDPLQFLLVIDDISIEQIFVDTEDIDNQLVMKVFPNPTRDFVRLELQQKAKVEAYDLLGKMIYSENVNDGISTIHHRFEPGMYSLKMTFENGKIANKKLIVE